MRSIISNIPIPKVLSEVFYGVFSSHHEKIAKDYLGQVQAINDLESRIQTLSDLELKQASMSLRTKVQSSLKDITDWKDSKQDVDILNSVRDEAFALVREAAKRTLKQRHYDVQMVGGMIMHSGAIAEMRTGEGKTLVATLPAYLNSLIGKGVHVITVNDYLSRRDAVWMGQIYSALGLTVAVINHDASYIYDPEHIEIDESRDEIGSFKIFYEFLRPCTRREAYQADITYGTNNEFGFDYLRDNLEYESNRLRQRDLYYAIVDEIDSILIDEARTPLIISAPTQESENLYQIFAEMVKNFTRDTDFTVDEKFRSIALTDTGIEKAEKMLGVDNIYTEKGIRYVHHLETAVKAKALYHADTEYVVKGGEVIIVDTFTGKLQPGRRWSDGLHQAIEAKENLNVQKESRTFASITFQNYFRMYRRLSGMTGTAMTSHEEFYKVYNLDTIPVPTHRPTARIDHNDLIFRTEAGKFKAIARKVKELHSKGQPVLIGTVSIEKNEMLSAYLKTEGVPHEILNAKNHEREGEIIAQAGKKGMVTVATNMAGRGVDIKLGGNPAPIESYVDIKAVGGLYVLGTERHEARRIDNQLRGRAGRQGDPGETQFFVSLEDSLMRVFASDTVKSLMSNLGVAEDEPIQNKIITRSLEGAQKRIEGFNFDSRKQVLEYDSVLNTQRMSIYARRKAILTGSIDMVKSKLIEIVGDDSSTLTIIGEKVQELGEDRFYGVVRMLLLQTIDTFWVDHLETMDFTRSSVNLRAYGQRDPLVEYKKEGMRLFRDMETNLSAQIIRILPHVSGGVVVQNQQKMIEVHNDGADISPSRSNTSTDASISRPNRNDPCHCGSGKKFKKCHGA